MAEVGDDVLGLEGGDIIELVKDIFTTVNLFLLFFLQVLGESSQSKMYSLVESSFEVLPRASSSVVSVATSDEGAMESLARSEAVPAVRS